MNQEELDNMAIELGKLDFRNMDLVDVATYAIALAEFCKKVKPIVLKYSEDREHSYLLKL